MTKSRRMAIAVILVCCAITAAFRAALPAAGAEGETFGALIREPVTEPDDSLSTGLLTRWTCVTFGAYPQTEIVAAPSDAVDAYAVGDGDFLVDPDLYDRLAHTAWEADETEIDGTRYRRISRDQTVTWGTDRAGHYRWGDEAWHYFRYDPIRWRVIGVEEGKVCLMADRLLDCQPFHAQDGPVSWGTSTVRSWLNGYAGEENAAGIDCRGTGFLDTAFSPSEREAILTTAVQNRPNSRYRTDCGEDTKDRIFLLSAEEVFESQTAARNGFYPNNGKDDPAKRFRSTVYAKCRGAWWSSVNGYLGNSFWFMRTNGYTAESVTYICDFGYIYQRGTICTCEDAGILPALWVDPDRAALRPAGTVTSKDIQANASAEPEESGRGRELIANPVVTACPEAPDGKEVTYSMVRFGCYPQAEIVPEASGASAAGIADADLYAALKRATWENDECEDGGRRYLRVRSSDGAYRYFACEPILWRVLEVRDGTALLLSDAAVDCEPFQRDLAEVSWENCTLRSYLNGYDAGANASGDDYSAAGASFLDRAFSGDEQAAILAYPVRNEDNWYFGMDSGHETVDKVFILAESELFIHDSSRIHGFSPRDEVPDRARQFTPTDYALWKGVWCASAGDDGAGNVFWITRTTGYTHANVVYVDESGYMYNRGILVTCADAAVIPALVLDLNSDAYEYAGTRTVGGPEEAETPEELQNAA